MSVGPAASQQPIYLDNNATTRIAPEVLQAMQDCWEAGFANPGSQHGFGRAARTRLEDARESIAEILDADPAEVIFTSGGTEAINLAVHGLTCGRRGTLLLTRGEHPAVREACEHAACYGLQQHELPVNDQGLLCENEAIRLLDDHTRLACLILAHNETGVLQNPSAFSSACQSHNVPLLLDAVQAVGKVPVSFRRLGAAALAFGAHKFHGPRGVGGLLLRRGLRLTPLLHGGHQEGGRRPGTEPVPLIVGMARALQLWQTHHEETTRHISTLRDQLEDLLRQNCAPVRIHGSGTVRLPNTVSIAFPGVSGEALLVNLHMAGVACSLGSTCASGSAEAAPALLAMGIPNDVCRSTIRLSLSRMTTPDEVHRAASIIAATVQRLRSNSGSSP